MFDFVLDHQAAAEYLN